MRKIFRRYLPTNETIRNQRWLKPFHGFLAHHNLWYLNRRSVAGGVAVGLFSGLIPGPLQIITATVLSVLFRVNLPVAGFMTLYTNPLTIVPLYMAAYTIGAWLTGEETGIHAERFALPELSWDNWLTPLWNWFVALGEPLMLGLPVLALLLALLGYILVRVIWRFMVIWKRYKSVSKPSV